ncbi:MAG: cation diffusion facilitator family transporter [Frankiaceae bacterium]
MTRGAQDGDRRGAPGSGHEPHAGHAHRLSGAADARYLTVALCLIGAFMVVEVVVALVAQSLALLADAGHLLTDVIALAAALVAARLAARPARGPWTFGLRRAEILSAAGNGVSLIVVAGLVVVEAVRRLIHPPTVIGGALVGVALAGVVVNLAATWTLAKADRGSLNVAGAFQHVRTDLYAFAGTVVAGLVVITTGWQRADPVASLVVAGLMIWAAAGLLRASGRILLEAAPAGTELAELRRSLRRHPEVASVHDVHVWTITSGFTALSAHVLTAAAADCHAVRRDLESELAQRYGIVHTTLQVDHVPPDVLTITASDGRPLHRPPDDRPAPAGEADRH